MKSLNPKTKTQRSSYEKNLPSDKDRARLIPDEIYLRVQVKCRCGCGGFVVRPATNPKEKAPLVRQYADRVISADRKQRILALFKGPAKTKRQKRILALLAAAKTEAA